MTLALCTDRVLRFAPLAHCVLGVPTYKINKKITLEESSMRETLSHSRFLFILTERLLKHAPAVDLNRAFHLKFISAGS